MDSKLIATAKYSVERGREKRHEASPPLRSGEWAPLNGNKALAAPAMQAGLHWGQERSRRCWASLFLSLEAVRDAQGKRMGLPRLLKGQGGIDAIDMKKKKKKKKASLCLCPSGHRYRRKLWWLTLSDH